MIEVNDKVLECAAILIDETGESITHIVSNPTYVDWMMRDGGFNPHVYNKRVKISFAQLVFDQFIANERREAHVLIDQMYED